MKLLFLLIILANIFILFWEYRSGAFVQAVKEPVSVAAGSERTIVLQHENESTSGY